MIRLLILASVLILLSGCARVRAGNEPTPEPTHTPTPVICGGFGQRCDVDTTGAVSAIDIALVRGAFPKVFRSCHQVQNADPGDPLIIEGFAPDDQLVTITVEGHGSQQYQTGSGGYWRVSFVAVEGGPYQVSDDVGPLCVAEVLPVVP